MNRESLPLIVIILTPIIIVLFVILHYYDFDFFIYIKKIDTIYYVIIFPFVLGLVAALLKNNE
jgi:hypothetical protein